MAEGVTLQLTFDTMSGSRTWRFTNANPSVTKAQVQNLGSTMITNGSIFENVPVKLTAAKTVVTTETEFDLS